MKAWTGSPEITLADEFGKYTVNVTSRIVFGIAPENSAEVGMDLHRDLSTVFSVLGSRFVSSFQYWRYFRLPKDRRVDDALENLKLYIDKMILQSKKRTASEIELRSILDAFINIKDHDNPKIRLSENEIFSNLMTLVLAGEDTTANLMIWAMYHIGCHPEVKSALEREAIEFRRLGKTFSVDKPFEFLPVAGRVIQESLRSRSPTPFLMFTALEDTEIEGVSVPKGEKVILLTRRAQLLDSGSKDLKAFDPARVLDDSDDDQISISKNRAFGGGARICPGRSMALVESAMLLQRIFERFDFQLKDTGIPTEEFAFVMRPLESIRAHLKPHKGSGK
ncbi:MAG: cytochrome P450 [Pseudobacteriovorax sp.]|nr:cytochrome P450 [Pseudobacteriovorax sp.]